MFGQISFQSGVLGHGGEIKLSVYFLQLFVSSFSFMVSENICLNNVFVVVEIILKSFLHS